MDNTQNSGSGSKNPGNKNLADSASPEFRKIQDAVKGDNFMAGALTDDGLIELRSKTRDTPVALIGREGAFINQDATESERSQAVSASHKVQDAAGWSPGGSNKGTGYGGGRAESRR